MPLDGPATADTRGGLGMRAAGRHLGAASTGPMSQAASWKWGPSPARQAAAMRPAAPDPRPRSPEEEAPQARKRRNAPQHPAQLENQLPLPGNAPRQARRTMRTAISFGSAAVAGFAWPAGWERCYGVRVLQELQEKRDRARPLAGFKGSWGAAERASGSTTQRIWVFAFSRIGIAPAQHQPRLQTRSRLPLLQTPAGDQPGRPIARNSTPRRPSQLPLRAPQSRPLLRVPTPRSRQPCSRWC